MNVLNEIKLKYKPRLKHDLVFDRPEIIQTYFRTMLDKNFLSEQSYAIYMNRANNPIGYQYLGTGSLTMCIIDVQMVCTSALLTRSAGVIVCHSHPSGALKASEADIKVTKQLKAALSLFDITLFDHIILTPGSYYSFQENNLL